MRWSVLVRQGDRVLLEEDADAVLATASIGKVLLLATVAARLDAGLLDPGERLSREGLEPVGDSGLWQLLDQQDLSIADACRLVAAVSDNLATNALLARVGLPAVEAYAASLGLHDVTLLDRVRDHRDPSEPGVAGTLSTASARGLVGFVRMLRYGRLSARLAEWLALNSDLSMVASAFGLDPLAHQGDSLVNKTGTDQGIRAEVGSFGDGVGRVDYAVIANWSGASYGLDVGPEPVGDPVPHTVPEVLARMRQIGDLVRVHATR